MKLNGTYLVDENVFFDTPVRWMWCIARKMKWNIINLDGQLTPRCGSVVTGIIRKHSSSNR